MSWFRRAAPVALVAGVLSGGAIYLQVDRAIVTPDGSAYVDVYSPPRNGLEAAINEHDGVAFAGLAMDPTLSRPEHFDGGASELAFRANRPMLGWLAWVGSAGHPGAVEWVLVALTLASVMALVVASGWLAHLLDIDVARAAVGVALLPGTLVIASYVGLADGLGTALALTGLGLWMSGRRGWAVAVLTAAVLTREAGLVAVVALGLSEMTERRWRRALPLHIPAAVYAGWTGIVWARLGYLPTSAEANNRGGTGFRTTLPGVGWSESIASWGAVEATAFLIVVAVIAFGLWRGRRGGPLTVFVWLGVVYATVLGWGVWEGVENFPRVLLPTTAAALLLAMSAHRGQRGGQARTDQPVNVDRRVSVIGISVDRALVPSDEP